MRNNEDLGLTRKEGKEEFAIEQKKGVCLGEESKAPLNFPSG